MRSSLTSKKKQTWLVLCSAARKLYLNWHLDLKVAAGVRPTKTRLCKCPREAT